MGAAGIYVHVPFCRRKCEYCDFVSYAGREDAFDAFGEALIREIRLKGRTYGGPFGKTFDTVFIGGGTPSILPESILGRVTEELFKVFNIADGCEFTIEANPGTVDSGKLKFYRSIGIDRISFGVQSTDEETLAMLGRIHGRREIFRAFEDAADAGFGNVNADLIFGLPGERPGTFEKTLREVLALGPVHVSAYSLIVEPDTPLCGKIENGILPEPSDVTDREDYRLLRGVLRSNGFAQYEISNFAKPGFLSRHNSKYWNQEEYVGLGPAAASFTDGVRYVNADSLSEYVASNGRPARKESVKLTEKELMDEYMMLGMRFVEGPDFEEFTRRFGADPYEIYGERLRRLIEGGYIEKSGNARRPFALTEKGLDFANVIFREFV
ncbi:MAG: radical SAM family heme chaperone HemW [Clostridia bacterium]|nr:radical SAM family heme chaperone HemW [Clostridia bacterium]